MTVTFDCREFTSLCPVTGQPDFAQLTIRYRPRKRLIETKSLKLYLWSFRERRLFNESIVAEIAATIMKQAQPEWVDVEGRFAHRGGIGVTAIARRS